MSKEPGLSLDAFDYSLPDSLIAQRPAEARSDARLLCVDRKSRKTDHRSFRDLPGLLRENDLLVINDTRVFPARLRTRRESGGAVEVLLLRYPLEGTETPCLIRPGRRIRDGERLIMEDGSFLLVDRSGEDLAVMSGDTDLVSVVERFGQVPLPPYIRRDAGGPDASDRERYQTVYAGLPGAVAAPTAGLHFDEGILGQVRDRGIPVGKVTLHVGPGTFQPVRSVSITDHRMEEECYFIPAETAKLVREAKERSGRIVAVGTTVVRALESAFDGSSLKEGEGVTSLFIYPDFDFSVVDALVTNFHLPRSTLLMLVCAFAGTDLTLKAYREAVKEEYRFYSYGDAMFIE